VKPKKKDMQDPVKRIRSLLGRVEYARKNKLNWRNESYLYMLNKQFEKKFKVVI